MWRLGSNVLRINYLTTVLHGVYEVVSNYFLLAIPDKSRLTLLLPHFFFICKDTGVGVQRANSVSREQLVDKGHLLCEAILFHVRV